MCGISAKGGVGSCNGQVGMHSRIGEGDDGIEGCNVNEGGRCSYDGSGGSVNDDAEKEACSPLLVPGQLNFTRPLHSFLCPFPFGRVSMAKMGRV